MILKELPQTNAEAIPLVFSVIKPERDDDGLGAEWYQKRADHRPLLARILELTEHDAR